MSQLLVALSAAAGVIVVGWLLVSGWRILLQTQRGRSAASQSGVQAADVRDAEWIYGDRVVPERRPRRIPAESGETDQESPGGHKPSRTVRAEGDAEAILRDAELKAAEILAGALRERENLLEERLASAERAASEVKHKAEREAETIVKNAQLRADEIIDGVERARARLEQEMEEVAREQALTAFKHKRLTEFLLTALDELERASANGSADLAGLEELRDELRSTE